MRVRRVVALAGFASALVLVAVPAVAAEGSTVIEAVEKERHCVVSVIGIAEDLELKMSPEQCFGTFSEAMLALSGGALQLPADTPVSVLSGSPSYMSSTFTIGIHYDYYNGGGSSISVSGSSCVGGWWNTPSWFDNRESSSYNGCYRLRHYDLPNKVGSSQSTTGTGQTDNLTTLNNRTESVSYHSS